MPEWFKGLTCYVRGCKSPVGSNPTRSANSIERKGAPAVIGRRHAKTGISLGVKLHRRPQLLRLGELVDTTVS